MTIATSKDCRWKAANLTMLTSYIIWPENLKFLLLLSKNYRADIAEFIQYL